VTTWEWVWLLAFLAAAVFVALGWAAFYPAWPPQEKGVHRAPRNPANPPDPAPTAEPWMWEPPTNPGPPARHRPEHLTELTQRIRPPRPYGPPPEWPPDNRIQ
jgi:hypothetical protein